MSANAQTNWMYSKKMGDPRGEVDVNRIHERTSNYDDRSSGELVVIGAAACVYSQVYVVMTAYNTSSK